MAAITSSPQIDRRVTAADLWSAGASSFYAFTALIFLVLGGVFGVESIVAITRQRMPSTVSATSLAAHGHAQIFGFLATVLFGLGFHWIAQANKSATFQAHLAWSAWTAGVATRWLTDVYGWHWNRLLPASAVLELLAFTVFAVTVIGARRIVKLDVATLLIIGGAVGFAIALVMNLTEAIRLATAGQMRTFPAAFDRRFLLICTWGFLAPVAWGLSGKWLPKLMGLKPTKIKILAAAGILTAIGIGAAVLGKVHFAAVLILHGAIFAPSSLKVFGRSVAPSQTTQGIYVRLAFVWLRIAATLGVWASVHDAVGIWAASRHALAVGFLTALVIALAQQVMPSFSERIAPLSLLLLNIGCLGQVVGFIFAYQGYGRWAWPLLPAAGIAEFGAFALFAANLVLGFVRRSTPVFAPVPAVAAED